MLHLDSNSSSTLSENVSTNCSSLQASESKGEVNSLLASTMRRGCAPVLLATAWVTVRVASGRTAVIRALIGQGSEMTFISENLAQILRAKRIRIPISVSAVSGVNAGTFQHVANIIISPQRFLEPSLSTTALILNSLTTYIPKQSLDLLSLSHLSDLSWADPDPTSSDKIHIIIGVDLYGDIILDGVRKGHIGQSLA